MREFRAFDAATEDEGLIPDYRRERHELARPRHTNLTTGEDGTQRSEIRHYLAPDPDKRNDAVAALEQVLEGGWVARWVFAEQGDGLVVRSLTIEAQGPVTPTGGLVADTLRRDVSPSSAVAAANQAMSEEAQSLEAAGQDDYPDESAKKALRLLLQRHFERRSTREPQPPAPGTGRPRLPDEFLAAVAVAYIEECQGGRGVLKRVGARVAGLRGLRPKDVPDQTTKDWVRLARQREFLGPAPKQGARGGTPGPRLADYAQHRR